MLVLRDKIAIGYSSQKIVLIDLLNELSMKYLNTRSSLVLYAILTFESNKECVSFLNENSIFYDERSAKAAISKLQFELKDYLVISNGNTKDNNKIDLQRLANPNINKFKNEYRLDYPVKLVWVPTWKCNRNCIYCGVAKIKPDEMEKQIPISIIYERFKEAIDMGVKSVNIHGGDPLFCYNDEIYEVIKFLSENHVKVDISTKNYISERTAERLKCSGLEKIQLSIDTTQNELLISLYGDPSYLVNFEESVNNLKKVRIQSTINIVVSSANYKNIPNLLYYLNDLEVEEVTMSNFRKGHINSVDYSLNIQQQDWLNEEILKIKKNLNFNKFSYGPFNPSLKAAKEKPICDSCRVSLMFLPDGRACYCDFLSNDERFLFGNLKEQTIDEIWNSDELYKFMQPLPEEFIGSDCEECEGLQHCINRGFCFLTSDSRKMFSPDFKSIECYELKGDNHAISFETTM